MEPKDSRKKVSVETIASIIVVVALASTAFLVLNNGLGTASDAQEPVPTSDYVLVTSLSSTMTSGAYKLDSDVEVSSAITIGTGVEVWIDLNGHDIVSTADANVFTVNSGGQLVIKDSALRDTNPSAGDPGDYRYAHMVIDGEFVDSANKGEGSAQPLFLLSKTYTATEGKVVINGVTMTLVDNKVTVDGTIITFDNSTGEGIFTKSYDVTNGMAVVNGIRTAVFFGKITHSDGTNGRGIYNGGTLWISGGAIIGNYFPGYGTSDVEKKGGGIYNAGNLYVVSGSISLNTSKISDGGGINVQSGSFEMRGGCITYNKTVTGGSGGGLMSQVKVYIHGAAINNNACAQNGGGLYVSMKSKATIDDVQLCCNAAGTAENVDGKVNSNRFGGGAFLGTDSDLSNCTFMYNYAPLDGGGLYLRSTKDSGRGDPTSNISGTTIISHNTAGRYGGGISAGSYLSPQLLGTLNIKSGTCAIDYNSASEGGGVRAYGGVTIADGSTVSISYNSATKSGGGLYVGNTNAKGTSSLVSCTISHNTAPRGAGIYSTSETLTIGATVDYNDGRGAYISGTNVTLDGAVVTNNTFNTSVAQVVAESESGDSGNGGGMYIDATNVVVKNTLFEQNSTSGPGGGLYLHYAPSSALDNVRFVSNTSGSNGGGLTVSASYEGSVLNLVGCTFTSNDSGNSGGGLYAGCDVVMSSSNISSNTSASSGGGIYCSGAVTMSSGTVALNTATTGNGGGIISSGKFTLTDGEIKGNNAVAGSGGGVYCASAELNGGVIGGDYKNGKLDKDGNSIDYLYYVEKDGALVLMDPDYEIKPSGSFVYTIYLLNEGQGNTCRDSGAGLYVSGDIVINGASIRGNAATGTNTDFNGGGGGVYCSSMTFIKGDVSGNQHIRRGGGIYCTGDVEIGNDLSSGNNARVQENISFDGGGITCPCFHDNGNVIVQANLGALGGGLYITDDTHELEIYSAKIEHNRSVTFAGGILQRGDMIMWGGSISYNRAACGGAGVTDYGSNYIHIKGGTISNNVLTGRYFITVDGETVEKYNYRGVLGGAGIYAKVGVIVTGGTISGNTIEAQDGASISGLLGTFIRMEASGSAYVARDIEDPDTISCAESHIQIDMYYLGSVNAGTYVGGYHSYMILPSGYATTKTFNQVIKYEILSPLSEGSTWVDRDPDDPAKVVVAGPETCLIGSIRAIYSDLTVKFDYNNGTGEFVYGQFTFKGENAYVDVTQVSPTYEGHLFLGWEYVNSSGENDHCAQGAKVSNAPVKSITFTAKWGDPSYTATLIV